VKERESTLWKNQANFFYIWGGIFFLLQRVKAKHFYLPACLYFAQEFSESFNSRAHEEVILVDQDDNAHRHEAKIEAHRKGLLHPGLFQEWLFLTQRVHPFFKASQSKYHIAAYGRMLGCSTLCPDESMEGHSKKIETRDGH